MGINNRQRRKDKDKKRKQKSSSTRAGAQERAHTKGERELYDTITRMTVLEAIQALDSDDEETYEDCLLSLVGGPPIANGTDLVDKTIALVFTNIISRLWSIGWQPEDVERIVRRKLNVVHIRLAISAIIAESSVYAPSSLDMRWLDQLRDLGFYPSSSPTSTGAWDWVVEGEIDRRKALNTALETLHFLAGLPEIPLLIPPPGSKTFPNNRVRGKTRSDHRGVDSRILERVRALLAKAESTSFTEEADAFTAKAQELMSRYEIDRAVLDASEHREGKAEAVRIGIDDPYADAKSLLLSVIAEANQCRSVFSKSLGFSSVFGFGESLEMVELLYTSLLVQAMSALNSLSVDASNGVRSRKRSFRHSFLVSYATRIGDRLEQAMIRTEKSAEKEYGGSLLPILANRREAVDEAVDEAYPDLVPTQMSARDSHGWLAGKVAADRASLTSSNPEVD